MPPLNYGLEREPWPGYREWVNDLPHQLLNAGLDDPATLALLRDRGITHVYIGQRQGRVNYNGAVVLNSTDLLHSPHYQPMYHQNQVWIFEVTH